MFKGKPKARTFDPKRGPTEGWKRLVAIFSMRFRPSVPVRGPVKMELRWFMPRPKRLMRRKDPDGPVPHTVIPDIDNLEKAVLDALKNSGWWRDDCQVWKVSKSKEYHEKGGVPGLWVSVEWERQNAS